MLACCAVTRAFKGNVDVAQEMKRIAAEKLALMKDQIAIISAEPNRDAHKDMFVGGGTAKATGVIRSSSFKRT